MRTVENRSRYNRNHLRYPSDVTDAEWSLIAPLIPPAKRGGQQQLPPVDSNAGRDTEMLMREPAGDEPPQKTGHRSPHFASETWSTTIPCEPV